ncbi:MAG: helix-turn-helix domain-containing protein [Flavobacteriales bacterium]|nr:helix-turn-helix domain-containing protein [Flavobacteriales bacterium]
MIVLITFFFISFNYFPSLNLSISQKLKNLDLFYADTRPGPYNYWGNWQTFFKGVIVPLIFVLLTIYEFFHFKKKNKNAQKNALLSILLIVILLFFFFNLASNLIYEEMEALSGWSMIEWPVDIVFLSIVLALLSVISLSVNSGASFLPPAKYVSSSLHEENYDAVISQISEIIVEKELYKESDFSLKRLAEEANSNTRYLSQAINHKLGMRFSDYVNEFRIKEAKRQLLLPDNRNLTIEAIGKNCGFQSKSTFFRIFKKVTNLTPKQFIAEQKKSGSNL